MKKQTIAIGLLAFSIFVGSQLAHAQTASYMPVLYDANGNTVNSTSGTVLPAGNYYVNGGPSQGGHLVYYYGNGTYYDATTQTYGGSVGDPNGTSGAALNYVAPSVTPGAPNTGAGGLAAGNWLILIAAGLVFVGSATYVVRRSTTA